MCFAGVGNIYSEKVFGISNLRSWKIGEETKWNTRGNNKFDCQGCYVDELLFVLKLWLDTNLCAYQITCVLHNVMALAVQLKIFVQCNNQILRYI